MQSEASNKDQLMIAASVNRDCHIYDIKYTENSDKVEEIGPKDDDDVAEKDSIVFDRDNVKTEKETSQSETDEDDNISINDSGYSIAKSACVTTDDAIKDSCQNVVRFIKNGSRVMTAGEDGIIRVWSVSLNTLYTSPYLSHLSIPHTPLHTSHTSPYLSHLSIPLTPLHTSHTSP